MVEPIKRTVRIDDDQSNEAIADPTQEVVNVQDLTLEATLEELLTTTKEILFYLKLMMDD